MTFASPVFVLPGQEIGDAPAATADGASVVSSPGAGTHIQNGKLFASVAGTLLTDPVTGSISVRPAASSLAKFPCAHRPVIPTVNSLVLGRVIRLTTRQATISILAIGVAAAGAGAGADSPAIDFVPCPTPFPALLRLQDVRATEKDKLKMLECFHVGDVVRALVISLGDQTSYYLSTARNDLGVVMAWSGTAAAGGSSGGEQLLPLNWREMMGAKTGTSELRKVAKPF